ncbi:hypothetical protein [Paenibacillus methanolicus]|nr:hypothetical protein [Paenibacillus methanolicus]
MTIVRGTQLTDPVVYSSTAVYLAEGTTSFFQQISAKAADYDVDLSANRILVYTAFISTDSACLRVVSESFNASAYRTIV